MRVAFVTQPIDSVLPPNPNSIGLLVRNTALRLATAHDVTIFVNRRRNDPARMPNDGINYRFVSDWPDVNALMHKFPGYLPHSRIVRSRLYYRRYAVAVAAHLVQERYDWVQILNFSQFLPIMKRRAPHIRFALDMHCEWLTQFPAEEVRRRLRHADLITSCSGYIAKLIRNAYPEWDGRCHALHNGYDSQRFTPAESRSSERPTKVLFVGRVSPEKGIHTLFDVMERVLAERPDCRLELVGALASLPEAYIVGISQDPRVQALAAYYDGTVCTDYQSYLKARASRPPLAGKVEFVGSLPQNELPTRYHRADVLINPSYSESFGMSLVEGMATGLPVVATRVGGMPEIVVPGVTGHLREAGDSQGLTTDLLDCLQSAGRRDALGAAGLKRVRQVFTWESRAQRLIGLFGGERSHRRLAHEV